MNVSLVTLKQQNFHVSSNPVTTDLKALLHFLIETTHEGEGRVFSATSFSVTSYRYRVERFQGCKGAAEVKSSLKDVVTV